MSVLRRIVAVLLLAGSGLAQASVTPWIDFQIVDGFVVVPTEIQGIKGYSVIDTGAQFTGIANSFIEQNKLSLPRSKPMRFRGVNGADTRPTYRDVPVTLMGSELVFGQLVNIDFGDRAQLLIGADFLRNLYFQFDYPNKRLRGISREVFDLKKLRNVTSKLDPVSRQPIVKVRLNDEHDTWLVMDTGSTGGVLMNRGIPRKKGWLEDYQTETLAIRGLVDSAQMEMFRLPLISIGPYNVRNARVTVPKEGQALDMLKNRRGAWGKQPKTRGLLGYDVLKNFVVTFDYRTGSVFFELPEEAEKGAQAGSD